MKIFFLRAEERSFTSSVARARFLWLLVASLLLPFAASLSHNAQHSDRFDSFVYGTPENADIH
ncbi:MAG: hypothetical protein ACXVB9_07570 [Bdellovibrionota bacterium]